jgi:hypothetical protein
MYKFIGLFLGITVLMMSCSNTKKTVTEQDPYDPALLVGTWQIEKEVCCGRNAVVTYGGTKELTIKAKDNAYILRENGVVLEKGTYKVDLKSEFGPVVTFDQQFPAMYQIDGNTLILNWGYMDLQEETYKRVR